MFGGPATYTAEHGGYAQMLAHHRDLGITAEQRFRFASLMSLAADDAGLPDDPEFRAAFVGYVEWGTRLALHNSQPGATVAAAAPVPRWGWGVAPPTSPESVAAGYSSSTATPNRDMYGARSLRRTPASKPQSAAE